MSLWPGQRPKQDGIDDGEDCRSHANPEREDKGGARRESRTAYPPAQEMHIRILAARSWELEAGSWELGADLIPYPPRHYDGRIAARQSCQPEAGGW